jgi:hypothetical protein
LADGILQLMLIAHNLFFAYSNSAHSTLSSVTFLPSIYMNDAPNRLAPEITLRELPASNIRRISDCPD